MGFVIDNRKCIGCHACSTACKSENDVPLGVNRTWVKYIETGEFPHTGRSFSVMRCNQCDDAPCMTICPTDALYRAPNGVVDFDDDRLTEEELLERIERKTAHEASCCTPDWTSERSILTHSGFTSARHCSDP